jgi:galactosamine-6-phosphate isomerase
MIKEVLADYTEMSATAAAAIIDCIKQKPDALLCFASGDTPKLTYQLASQRIKNEKIDISQVFMIGLDEWLGIPPADSGSCHYFLQQYLFQPMHVPATNYHLFDALTTNEAEECRKMDQLIFERRGIDIMVVGVGMNGHIGFNEPGTPVDSMCHVAALDEITQTVGQKYFTGNVVIGKGITVGLKQVMEAKTLLMIANGKKKAQVIQKTLEGEIGNHFPASLIREHTNGILLIDREAHAN